jgi:hypothetical protein
MHTKPNTSCNNSGRRFLHAEANAFFENLIRSSSSAIYACFTFKHNVNEEQADITLRCFVDELERFYRENIGWIRSTEVTLSGCSNFAVRRHIHAVFMSKAHLSPIHVQNTWHDRIGNCKCEPYDLEQRGIGYILKSAGHEQNDWDISRNLILLNPSIEITDKRDRRAYKRQHDRAQKRSQLTALRG